MVPGKFTRVATHTPAKIAVERTWRDPAMGTLPLRDGLVVTLVGHRDGLVPHLYEFCMQGIPDDQVIVIDRDPLVVTELKAEADRLDLECAILCGDYVEWLDLILSDGYTVRFADFDGTSNISDYHYKLVDLHRKYPGQIECMSICAATRSRVGKTNVEGLVRYIQNDLGMSCIARSYMNQGPMVSILLSPYQIQYQLPDDETAAAIHQFMLLGKTQRSIAQELSIDLNIVHRLPKQCPITFGRPR